ncbi:hypothetical protein [Candidatus Phytoplasma ziziphi]|uniref:hypothetical protein n=1 Tax=Ziziphus jujuba witches'-broom phytoplasma TaxID=135727 RepID=UPI001F3E589F|nr:hypothetical protein [Candidatus Phytoplasma ziziphi]
MPKKTLNNLNKTEIDAIYFDDGIRILSVSPQTKITSESIEDLLQLSNGAKNIYLFTFDIYKKIIKIDLPDSENPYEAIRNWKRDNNFYNFEGKYNQRLMRFHADIEVKKESIIDKKFDLSTDVTIIEHIFETKNTIYYIICQDLSFKLNLLDNYHTQYLNWLKQCYIQYNGYYTVNEVRSKIGRSNKTLYDENGNTHYYTYQEGWIYDNWQIDGVECVDKRYYQFLDTTPPPKKPKELN